MSVVVMARLGVGGAATGEGLALAARQLEGRSLAEQVTPAQGARAAIRGRSNANRPTYRTRSHHPVRTEATPSDATSFQP
jgi:hypothetical protein